MAHPSSLVYFLELLFVLVVCPPLFPPRFFTTTAQTSNSSNSTNTTTTTSSQPPPPPLNITAISSRDGYSVLECWQLASVPSAAHSAINYVLGGNITEAVWSIIEPQTLVGEAWAPTVQLTIVLNGLVRVTAPSPVSSSNSSSSTQTSTINAASNITVPSESVGYFMPGTLSASILIAADLHSISDVRGHFTEFPSTQSTVLVQIPFVDNAVPEHDLIGDGPCP